MKSTMFAVELMIARKNKKLTQEQVCFETGIAEPATLSRWENAKEIPSGEMFEKLQSLYEDPYLDYLYLQECIPSGRRVLPIIERRDLGNSVLMLQKEHTDINKIKDTIIEIACDGQIDEHEKVSWEESMQEILELASACMRLRFIQTKKHPQGCSLVSAHI